MTLRPLSLNAASTCVWYLAMLSEILILLKDAVNEYLRSALGPRSEYVDGKYVDFLETTKADSAEFKANLVTLLLVNLEEDHLPRPADPHRRTLPDGTFLRMQPPIYINAYVLFVARFPDYATNIQFISRIMQFFQVRRVLDSENTPSLGDRGIERLAMDLMTLPFSEQNHLWGMLRSAYQPSLLYRVRTAVFSDVDALPVPTLEPQA